MLATEQVKYNFLDLIEKQRPIEGKLVRGAIATSKIFCLQDFDTMIKLAMEMTKNAELLSGLARLPFPDMIIDYKAETTAGITDFSVLLHQENGDTAIQFVDIFIYTEGNTKRCSVPLMGILDPATLKIENGTYTVVFNCELFDETERAQNQEYLNFLPMKIIFCLAMLNSPSIIEKTENTFTRINRKRIERGAEPLVEYSLIKLQKHIAENITNTDPDNPQRKLHWRRGHFKMRKTGIFWWNAHTAGHKELGEIKSGYMA